MTYSIDRFEGDIALLCDEEETMRPVLRERLPLDAAEGDIVVEEAEGFRIDKEATEARRALVRRLLAKRSEE